jgi:hypothetical protein
LRRDASNYNIYYVASLVRLVQDVEFEAGQGWVTGLGGLDPVAATKGFASGVVETWDTQNIIKTYGVL